MRTTVAQIAFRRGGLIGLAIFIAYLAVAPDHIVDGEHAHFVTLGALGGVAHPSGYPLYVLWLRATSWLPGTPAQSAAIATAILAAAQMVMLHAACRAWGARATAASLAVAVYAGAPLVLAIDTEPEVFALNGLIVATVLWLAASRGPLRGAMRCGALGLVAGLGLANHMTCALVAPVGILGVVRGVRETSGSRTVAGGLAIAGVAVGLLPYLYLPLAPVHLAAWGQIDHAGAIIDVILRHDYGGPGAFAGAGDRVPLATNLGALVQTLGRTWLWLPGALGIVILGVRSVRPRDDAEPRWGWAMLAASFLLAGPILASRFNVNPEAVGRYVVERFHLLPGLLLAIPIASGFDQLGARFANRSVAVGALISVLVFAAVAATSLPHLAGVHAPAVEGEARNVLASLPPAAVVIGEADDFAGGINYAQLVLGERPDVAYVHWPMMKLRWYRERLAPHGIDFDAVEGTISSVRLVERLFEQGRPVFVETSKLATLGRFPHYPYGILVRLVPPGTPAPTLDDVIALNKAVYAGYTFDYARPGPADEWPTAVHLRYAATWNTLGHALEAAGRREDAAFAFEAARAIGPRP